MKKIFALILTLALVFSLAAVPAYAADPSSITAADGSATKDVTATYNAGSSSQTVYSVTITWGDMDFEYNDGTWDPNTHTYKANWTQNGNTVTVTNHSNAAITAKLSYTHKTGFDGITGTFDNQTLSLATAVGTDVSAAPTATATLTLSGALTKTDTVGTITVTLQ